MTIKVNDTTITSSNNKFTNKQQFTRSKLTFIPSAPGNYCVWTIEAAPPAIYSTDAPTFVDESYTPISSPYTSSDEEDIFIIFNRHGGYKITAVEYTSEDVEFAVREIFVQATSLLSNIAAPFAGEGYEFDTENGWATALNKAFQYFKNSGGCFSIYGTSTEEFSVGDLCEIGSDVLVESTDVIFDLEVPNVYREKSTYGIVVGKFENCHVGGDEQIVYVVALYGSYVLTEDIGLPDGELYFNNLTKEITQDLDDNYIGRYDAENRILLLTNPIVGQNTNINLPASEGSIIKKGALEWEELPFKEQGEVLTLGENSAEGPIWSSPAELWEEFQNHSSEEEIPVNSLVRISPGFSGEIEKYKRESGLSSMIENDSYFDDIYTVKQSKVVILKPTETKLWAIYLDTNYHIVLRRGYFDAVTKEVVWETSAPFMLVDLSPLGADYEYVGFDAVMINETQAIFVVADNINGESKLYLLEEGLITEYVGDVYTQFNLYQNAVDWTEVGSRIYPTLLKTDKNVVITFQTKEYATDNFVIQSLAIYPDVDNFENTVIGELKTIFSYSGDPNYSYWSCDVVDNYVLLLVNYRDETLETITEITSFEIKNVATAEITVYPRANIISFVGEDFGPVEIKSLKTAGRFIFIMKNSYGTQQWSEVFLGQIIDATVGQYSISDPSAPTLTLPEEISFSQVHMEVVDHTKVFFTMFPTIGDHTTVGIVVPGFIRDFLIVFGEYINFYNDESFDVTCISNATGFLNYNNIMYITFGLTNNYTSVTKQYTVTSPYQDVYPGIIGIAKETIPAGTKGRVGLGGQITNLTGLEAGTSYYCDELGNLTTDKTDIFVGVAASSSKLIFNLQVKM